MKKISLVIIFIFIINSLTACIKKSPAQYNSSDEPIITSSNSSPISSQVDSLETSSAISSQTQSDVSSTLSKSSSNNVSSQKTSSNTSSKGQSSQSSSSSQNTSSEIDLSNCKEPLPPVSKELQQKYLKGLEIYKWFYTGGAYAEDCTITKDGTRVPDDSFTNYESFYMYIMSCFAHCYLEERLLNSDYYFSDEMSNVLKKNIERAKYYEGHSFIKESESEDEIIIKVLVNFNENGKRFQTECPLTFEKTDGYWAISNFYLWYPPYNAENEQITIL